MAMEVKPEYYRLLDYLCSQGIFGNAVFYFENGEIKNVRVTQELKEKDLVDTCSNIKPRRVLVIKKKVSQDIKNAKSAIALSTNGNNGESEQT